MAEFVPPRPTRVHISFEDIKGGKAKELAFRMAVIGDFTRRPTNTDLKDRKPIEIDDSNFSDRMAAMDVGLGIKVKDVLSGEEDQYLPVDLKFRTMTDFEPPALIQNVPELKKLLEMRALLERLTSDMTKGEFVRALNQLIGDDAAVAAIVGEGSSD